MNGSASSPTASENAASKPASAPSRPVGDGRASSRRGGGSRRSGRCGGRSARGEQAGDEDGLGAGKDREGSGAPAEGGPYAPVEDRGVEGEQQQRPQDRGDPLRPDRAGEAARQEDQAGDRRIDEARPVHRRRAGMAVLDEIEPGLAGEEVAHLHEPHGVVGVGQAQVARDREEVGPGRRADEPGQHEEPDDPRPLEGGPPGRLRSGPGLRSGAASMTGSCGPKNGSGHRPLRTIALTPG